MESPPAQPFAAFMAECLYAEGGYYTTGRNFQTTPPADFTTAPELTPLFGATLGHWLIKTVKNNAQYHHKKEVFLAELGPGRGSLMRALLTHVAETAPALAARLTPWLVETSPALRTIQQHTLAAFPHSQWAPTLSDIPPTAPLIIIANEVLDACPAQPYRLSGTGWEMLWVEGDETHWRPSAAPPLPHGAPALEEDAILEHSPTMDTLVATIRTHASHALLLDYGYETLPPSGANTLQAVHAHQKVPLTHKPGQTDLTVHVNFQHVQHLLGPTHCTLTGMADMLLAHGLAELALPLLQHPTAGNPTAHALHRLLHPQEMGTLFKVLAYAGPMSA